VWEEIEAKKRRLDASRLLAAASLAALEAWCDVELTFMSLCCFGGIAISRASASSQLRGISSGLRSSASSPACR
jgi:hypothetical protein